MKHFFRVRNFHCVKPSSPQGASDEFPQLEEYAQYLSAVVDEESNPRVNAIAKVFGEALERDCENPPNMYKNGG